MRLFLYFLVPSQVVKYLTKVFIKNLKRWSVDTEIGDVLRNGQIIFQSLYGDKIHIYNKDESKSLVGGRDSIYVTYPKTKYVRSKF